MSGSSIDPDQFDRVAKLLVDDGQAQSFAEAEQILAGYRLQVLIGEQACTLAAWQAAALSVVNAGRRAVHGGVSVVLAADAPCALALAGGQGLSEALTAYGATVVDRPQKGVPTIVLGDGITPEDLSPVCYASASTWSAGVAPTPATFDPAAASIPAAVMAGAIAVSECFQSLCGHPVAANRKLGVSLWNPAADWLSQDVQGPEITRLPSGAWLLGLGHLGQAYAWLLALLAYPQTGQRPLVLHDDDRLSFANRATSMLHTNEQIGIRKTRLLCPTFERLGWDVRMLEHRYLGGPLLAPGDPTVLLAGLDNPQTRALLEETGIPLLIDAGLGAGPEGYLGMSIRTLPGTRSAAEIFSAASGADLSTRRALSPAYGKLESASGDRCGVEQLAGRTVATAFVGVVAACWAIGGLLRELHGGARYELIDYSLRNPGSVRAVRLADARPPRVGTVAVNEAT
jgi:hypothetical protein